VAAEEAPALGDAAPAAVRDVSLLHAVHAVPSGGGVLPGTKTTDQLYTEPVITGHFSMSTWARFLETWAGSFDEENVFVAAVQREALYPVLQRPEVRRLPRAPAPDLLVLRSGGPGDA